jgi:CRP-like cAMP-binding protein
MGDVTDLLTWLQDALKVAHDIGSQCTIDGHELPLTHKFLGIMLGVQRPAVTVAIRALEEKRLISAGRRSIP